MSEKSVVVIGGGVVGSACAYYLSREGFRVTILDKQQFGAGCSHANCGYVCPSHVIPLAEPGALSSTFKALFKRNSPMSVKPRLDFRLWAWLLKFARYCNRRDMLAGGHALQLLLRSSMAEFEWLVANEPLECEWRKNGLLYVYRDKQRLDAFENKNRLLSETFGEPAVKYDSDRLAELEPALKPGLAGGWYFEQDAHVRSDRLMASWKSLLAARGVEIREQIEVRRIVHEQGRAVKLVTSSDEISADQFVVATGALTPLLEKSLGCKIPIQPGKGYSLTMPRPKICPEIPMIFPEHRVGVTPFESGYRLGSIMEFAGYDTSIKPQRLALLRDGASHYLQEPFTEPVEEEWYGWRPMTPDSLPIIGRAPAFQNLYIAAGHNMIGLSMSTGTGRLIAEMIAGRPPHIDPEPYRPTRF
jgi:D-amino-acid dehydrogenase